MKKLFILIGILSIDCLALQAQHEQPTTLFVNEKAFEFSKIMSTKQRIFKPYVSFRDSIASFFDQMSPRLNFMASIYELRNFKTIPPSIEFIIPPIIHQIWLGDVVPEKYKQYQQSIFDMHNGWFYKLWTDEDIAQLDIHNKDLLDKACTRAEKANLLRYEILNMFGGVYIDMDAQLLKPLNPFHKRFDFYVGLQGRRSKLIGNAIIGACPGHSLLQKIIKTIKDSWFSDDCEKSPQMRRSGVILWTHIILEEIALHPRATIFPPTYFYPWNKKGAREEYIKPETFMVHDYDMTWSKI